MGAKDGSGAFEGSGVKLPVMVVVVVDCGWCLVLGTYSVLFSPRLWWYNNGPCWGLVGASDGSGASQPPPHDLPPRPHFD